MLGLNLITGIIGIGMLIAFVGTLVLWLKSVPLTIIALGVLALVGYDLFISLKEMNGSSGG
ncbi:MAG TPA: hypothetical protein VLG66_08765 [Alphaproteobacteria bacterium]|jgi:hypothetical protein|nr:hypothetical protein [Alphaproteobacteria bacterium]